MNKSLIIFLTNKTKNRGCSVDADFQNWGGSELLSLLSIKAANTMIINNNNQFTFKLPDLQNK